MNVEILIVGGGIAGLWLLAELRDKGVNALLVADELGKGQTIASQGIIHGGTKYALIGKVTDATLAIGDMPRIWRAALQGEGAVDLSQVNLLAESQLLWTSSSMGSRLTGFFASKAMKSRMEALPVADYPTLFQHTQFQGGLYRLDEPVLDIPVLLACLRDQLADRLLQVDIIRSGLQAFGGKYAYHAVLPDGQCFDITAQHIVLTAGVGNERLLAQVSSHVPNTQRRPLQMVMLRGDLPLVYAHALGMSDKPRATITSHIAQDGKTVWYIGGQPAEQGFSKPATEVIMATHTELQALLPWMDFSTLEWATWHVDRAEMAQSDGGRPDQPSISQIANVTVAWPTKLAFAPMLATQLCKMLSLHKIQNVSEYKSVHFVPPVAEPIWNQVKDWKPIQ